MNLPDLFWYSVLAFIAIVCLIQLLRNTEEESAVIVPKQVDLIDDLDDHTAQEVYDWVVYNAKVLGRRYLSQLSWSHISRHDFLLSDIVTAGRAKSQDDMLAHLKMIGDDHWLVTDMADAPY